MPRTKAVSVRPSLWQHVPCRCVLSLPRQGGGDRPAPELAGDGFCLGTGVYFRPAMFVVVVVIVVYGVGAFYRFTFCFCVFRK